MSRRQPPSGAPTLPRAGMPPVRWLPPGWALVAVMVGGALGTGARYLLGQRFPVEAGSFPTTTLVENVIGAALLGGAVTLMAARRPRTRWLPPLVATGVLGSFTTFSTFATELVLLVRDDQVVLATGYAAATIVLGVAAAVVGIAAAGGRRPRLTGSSGP